MAGNPYEAFIGSARQMPRDHVYDWAQDLQQQQPQTDAGSCAEGHVAERPVPRYFQRPLRMHQDSSQVR